MKKVQIVLISLMCFVFFGGRAQNAPVTKAGSITNAVPGTISIPVTVSNFINIGGITLTLDYDPAVLSFMGATNNAAFSGMNVTANTPGRILIGWVSVSGGTTLPDMTHMVDISFTYISGTSALTWYNNGGTCEFTNYASGIVLNDLPTSSYYVNGIVTDHTAPLTIAPVITQVSGTSVTVPVTVSNFTNIKTISLSLEYDPFVLTFQNATANSVFDGGMVVSSLISTGGKRKIIMSYMGMPISSLPDGSHLVDLVFTYSNLNGSNYSELTWINGGSSEYTDQFDNTLVDDPTTDYYQNGLVTSQLAPVTLLPTITNASAGPLNIPVKVIGFKDIKVLSLTFEYNPAVMTYVSNTPNAVFGSGLLVFAQNLPNGNKKLVMSWLGSVPATIADNGTITILNFTYLSGTTALTWPSGGASCEYADINDNPLWDMPTATHYTNGLVTAHAAPRTKAETLNMAASGVTVSVPVNVWNFANIGSFTLTLDYDPGVLTYLGNTPNSSLVATLSVSAASGRIQMGWYYTGAPNTSLSFPDSTTLITLNFTYHGGTSPLIFYNIGGTCEYTEGVTNTILNDLPTSVYYINGKVAPYRKLNLKTYIEGLYNTTTKQMNHVRNEIANQYTDTDSIADQVTVELHDATNYSHIVYVASNVNFSINGVVYLNDIPDLYSASYYLTVRHRNAVETTSATPVSFAGGITIYSFNVASKAFGSNMKQLSDGAWVIYSGDVNQDGIIDAADMIAVDNDAATNVNGYVVTDINGDGVVDTTDITFLDTNANNFIGAIKP